MDIKTFQKFIACIDAIECRGYMQSLKTGSYSHLKNKSDQKQMFNEYKKIAYPENNNHLGETVTSEEFARALGNLVNG